MLSRMFDKRCAGYEAAGYTVLLPASALPGWPVQVPLPIDPQWKQDYAARVKRLIRDGVAKLAVEIDGLQHLGDAPAYRRDRRKDALLQVHGYLVLRFQADAIGKHLEMVLDTVSRMLASRTRLSAASR